MTNYNDEYFFISTDGEPRHTPVTMEKGQSDLALFDMKPVEQKEPFALQMGFPIPSRPLLVDCHHMGVHRVISQLLKNALEPLNLKNVQFVPAEIKDKKNIIHDGYYIIHVYNSHSNCIDLEKSDYTTFIDGDIQKFKKLVLNNDVLDKIPLEDRLAFTLGEATTYKLFHQSVVEKMLEARPKGMTIYRISKWSFNAPFAEEASTIFKK